MRQLHDCRLEIDEAPWEARAQVYSRWTRLPRRRIGLLCHGGVSRRSKNAVAVPWPKLVFAVELENRLGDEIEATLEEFPHHTNGGVVLKVVVKRKGDPTGIIKP
jgi:hypothetical protein